MEGTNWQAPVPVFGVSGGATWNLRCLLQHTFRTLSAGAPAERRRCATRVGVVCCNTTSRKLPSVINMAGVTGSGSRQRASYDFCFSDSPAYKIAGHVDSVQEVRVGKSCVVEVPALHHATINLPATISICHVFYCTLMYYKACYAGMNCICHC